MAHCAVYETLLNDDIMKNESSDIRLGNDRRWRYAYEKKDDQTPGSGIIRNSVPSDVRIKLS